MMARNEDATRATGLNVQDSQSQYQNGVDASSDVRVNDVRENDVSKRKRVGKDVRVFYALPKDRFINLVRFFMVLEIGVSAGLFCTVYAKANSGSPFRENSHAYGSGEYSEMILDVILVEIMQFVLILFTHMRLETLAVRLADSPFNREFGLSKKRCHIFNILLTTLTLVYYCIKGSLMLAHQINSNFSQNMIENYFMLFVTVCDCFHIAAAVLFCFQIRKVPAMVRDSKYIHYYNKNGVRVDSDGVPVNRSSKLKFASHVQRVLALTRPEWKLLVLGTLCLLVASVSVMLLPYYFGQVIDNALDPKSDSLNRNVLILGVIAASGSVFAFVRGWAFSLAGYRLVSSLRKDLFRAIVRQEIAFFDVSRVGELTSRLSSDTQVIQTNITTNMSMLLRYLVQIIGSVAIMLWLSAPLTAVMLAVVPVVAIGAAQYGSYYSKKVKGFQDALGVANTTAEESLSNIRTIRSFACDEKACENYNKDIDNSLKVGSSLAFVYGMFQGIISLLIQASLVLILWYGGKLVLEHSKNPSNGVSIGVLSSFMMYALNVAMAFAFLSSIFGDIMKAVGASYRLFAIMDREPQVRETGLVALSATGVDSSPFEPKVEFRNVTFCYPSRPNKDVIKNISFCVDAGSTVALVGPSGGGKSTCINLLLHFYEPTQGKVLFSNEDIQDLDCEWYHEQIAVVSQEPVLFGFSVAENIAFGSHFSMDQIKEAATLANAHEFICNLDKGYDSLVGERGVRLSGGQKQRIAIARALIRNPKVLLLDEATSALDAESEAIVKDAIDKAMKNRTVLVIAHRLSTVIDADMVIVIEDGEIREKGTHEELIQLNGVYKKLIVNQLMSALEPPLDLVDAENQADMSRSPLFVNNVKQNSTSQSKRKENDLPTESQTSFEALVLPEQQSVTTSNSNFTEA